MATYEVWKLAVDVALCLSLFFLAFRFFRTGHLPAQTRKTAELEATLRRLIQDAKEAGSELNNELYRRQTALEKALAGIEQAEGKIRSVTNLADEKCGAISQLLSKTQDVMEELRNSPTLQGEKISVRTSAASEAQLPPARQDVVMRREERTEIGSEIRQQAASVKRAYAAVQRPVSRQAEPIVNGDSYSAWLDQAADVSSAPDGQSALRKSIEKEVEIQASPARTPVVEEGSVRNRLAAALTARKQGEAGGHRVVEQMENIYQLAENLLRAGHEVDAVITETKLPPRKVQALSDMIEREKAYGFDEGTPEPAPASGLGALSGTRRLIDAI